MLRGGCLQGLAGFLGSRWWVWGGLAQHLIAGWGLGPRSPTLLVSASGVLGCEEAATEQTNRACEDRKQLRTTRPRLLRVEGGQAEAGIGRQLGVAGARPGKLDKEVLDWWDSGEAIAGVLLPLRNISPP